MRIASLVLESRDESWRWKNRNTVLIDGFTFKMPDTPKNQAIYPQHTAQKPGLGFPIARVVALLHLGTGCFVDAAIGPCQARMHLNMDFMRCKSPPMVNTEFWMKLLAYNLIRMTAGVAAKRQSILPRE
ncbi:MAG: hypothetical protein ACK553_04825, partial [Planctomycetota bacterium]